MSVEKLTKFLFRHTGICLGKRPRRQGKGNFNIDGFYYGFVLPYATLAPWEGDADFRETYKKIRHHTLVDEYRCFELWQLVEKAVRLAPEAGILEVGVWRGGTAAVMARHLSLLEAHAPVFLADTFTGVAKAGAHDPSYKGGEHSDTTLPMVEALLRSVAAYPHLRILPGIFPEETAHLVPADQRFSLVHIDVDVYESARDVLEWAWPRLVPGGCVVFDDYGFHTCTGIAKLVHEYLLRTDRQVIHNLNGHALMIKIA